MQLCCRDKGLGTRDIKCLYTNYLYIMNTVSVKRVHWAQYVILVQAILATVWSLYYQYFGDPVVNVMAGNIFAAGGGFLPCLLCRWARILMYPIVLLSFISIRKKDWHIVDYLSPMSIMWILLETYHYILQKTDWLDFIWWWTFCTRANPCSALQVNYFDFITIPFLCLVAFIVIFICCIVIKRALKKQTPLHHSHL